MAGRNKLNVALKMAILQSGRTQARIARLARVDHTLLSMIVRGHREATESQKAKLANVLGLSVDELFQPKIAA